MENMWGEMNNRGENMYTSASLRFKPSSTDFEDLGTSFKPSQGKDGTSCKSSKSTSRSRDCSESEDEMDCLSQSTQADEKEVLDKGRKSEFDISRLEEKSNAIRGLKFTKKKQTNVKGENAPCKTKLDTQKTRLKASKTESDLVKGRDRITARKTIVLSSLEKPGSSVPRPRPTRSKKLPTPDGQRNTISLSLIPLPSPLSTQKNVLRERRGRDRSPSDNGSDSPSSHSSLPIHSTIKKVAIKEFPPISPFSSPTKVKTSTNVKDLPLSHSATERKSGSRKKGKSKAILKPFPLSTQDFAGVAFSSSKRSDEDDSDTELRLTKRKSKPESITDQMDLYEEEDSMFITARIDPTTLCPFCDTSLPSSQTPILKRLLQNARKNSHPSPRPSNSLGRKAALSVFVAVCQRHEFESKILPEAEKNGWPKDIDWEDLSERTKRLKVHLRAIIDDPELQEDYPGDWESYISGGPKARCTFWREAVKAIKARGMRDVTGVRGQFQDFDKAQPGYYGEMGSLIIQQTLMNTFPPGSLDSSLITPFTPNEFIQRILVPEVALRLIMDDQKLKGVTGAATALQVLRDSSAYGLSMFPEGDGDADDVADRMMMEMARKRRKEIEQEKLSATSNEIADISEAEIKVDRRRKRGEINSRKASGTDSETKQSSQRPRPKPHKPLNRETKSGTMSLSESQSESEIYNTDTNNRTVPAPRPRRNLTTVKYTEISSDEESSTHTQSHLRKRSKVPSRSPSLGIFCSSSPRDKNSKDFSDMDISSCAEDIEILQDEPWIIPTSNSSAGTPAKQRPRPHPLFEDNEATPRPVTQAAPLRAQESILARARDRRFAQANEVTKEHQNSTSIDPWLPNMRAHISDDSSDSDDDMVSILASKAESRQKEDEYSWLLSDPSSQETTERKSKYHRK